MTKDKDNKPNKNPLRDYTRYIGLGFQIVAFMLIGIGIGQWLDGYFGNETPILTILFAFIAIIAIIYNLIKELS